MAPDFQTDIETWPSFVALPLAEYAHEQNPILRLWAMCDATEMMLRLFVITGLSDILRSGEPPSDLMRTLSAGIHEPTLGVWRAMAGAVSRNLPADTLLPELPAFLRDRLEPFLTGSANTPEHSVAALRNRLAHGGGITRVLANRLLSAHASRFDDTMRSAKWLASLAFLGRSREGRLVALRGAANPHQDASGLIDQIAQDLALKALDGGEGVVVSRGASVVSLWPFATFGDALTSGDEVVPGSLPTLQGYARRGAARLLLTPLGSDDVAVSVSSEGAFRRFCDLFERPTHSIKDFAIRGFDADMREDARRAVGRERETVAALSALTAGQDAGMFAIWGEAGSGKSVLLAQIACSLADRAEEDVIVLPFRFRRGDARCSRSAFLAFAIERLDAWLRRRDAQPPTRPGKQIGVWRELLRSVAPGRVYLLLDGIDELVPDDPAFVKDVLQQGPVQGVFWLLAGRSDGGLPTQLLGAAPIFDGGMPRMTADEVREMLLSRIDIGQRRRLLGKDQERVDKVFNPFVARVEANANGLPIYVSCVINDILSGEISGFEERLPRTLSDYYDREYVRYSVGSLQQAITPLICTLAVAREALPRSVLRCILERRSVVSPGEAGEAIVDHALAAVSSMLRSEVDGTEPMFSLQHQSRRDHLATSASSRDALDTARRALAQVASEWRTMLGTAAADYTVRHAVSHLLDVGDVSGAVALFGDEASGGYISARLEREPIGRLLDDIDRTLVLLVEQLDAPRAVKLADLRVRLVEAVDPEVEVLADVAKGRVVAAARWIEKLSSTEQRWNTLARVLALSLAGDLEPETVDALISLAGPRVGGDAPDPLFEALSLQALRKGRSSGAAVTLHKAGLNTHLLVDRWAEALSCEPGGWDSGIHGELLRILTSLDDAFGRSRAASALIERVGAWMPEEALTQAVALALAAPTDADLVIALISLGRALARIQRPVSAWRALAGLECEDRGSRLYTVMLHAWNELLGRGRVLEASTLADGAADEPGLLNAYVYGFWKFGIRFSAIESMVEALDPGEQRSLARLALSIQAGDWRGDARLEAKKTELREIASEEATPQHLQLASALYDMHGTKDSDEHMNRGRALVADLVHSNIAAQLISSSPEDCVDVLDGIDDTDQRAAIRRRVVSAAIDSREWPHFTLLADTDRWRDITIVDLVEIISSLPIAWVEAIPTKGLAKYLGPLSTVANVRDFVGAAVEAGEVIGQRAENLVRRCIAEIHAAEPEASALTFAVGVARWLGESDMSSAIFGRLTALPDADSHLVKYGTRHLGVEGAGLPPTVPAVVRGDWAAVARALEPSGRRPDDGAEREERFGPLVVEACQRCARSHPGWAWVQSDLTWGAGPLTGDAANLAVELASASAWTAGWSAATDFVRASVTRGSAIRALARLVWRAQPPPAESRVVLAAALGVTPRPIEDEDIPAFGSLVAASRPALSGEEVEYVVRSFLEAVEESGPRGDLRAQLAASLGAGEVAAALWESGWMVRGQVSGGRISALMHMDEDKQQSLEWCERVMDLCEFAAAAASACPDRLPIVMGLIDDLRADIPKCAPRDFLVKIQVSNALAKIATVKARTEVQTCTALFEAALSVAADVQGPMPFLRSKALAWVADRALSVGFHGVVEAASGAAGSAPGSERDALMGSLVRSRLARGDVSGSLSAARNITDEQVRVRLLADAMRDPTPGGGRDAAEAVLDDLEQLLDGSDARDELVTVAGGVLAGSAVWLRALPRAATYRHAGPAWVEIGSVVNMNALRRRWPRPWAS